MNKRVMSWSGMALLAALWVCGTVWGANYVVDSTEPEDQEGGIFTSLESLREYVTTWNSNDTVELRGDDDSLGAAINFGNAQVVFTATRSGAVTPGLLAEADKQQFLKITGNVTLLAADGEALTVAGFDSSRLDYALGGAIWLGNGATLTLGKAGSTGTLEFADNEAQGGGAINVEGGYTANIVIEDGNVSFTGNTATYYGGAISNYGDGTIWINGGKATFTDNTAGDGGGAISGTTTISGGEATFTGNMASEGGAISGTTTISGGKTTFTDNTASYSGGAISGTTTISGGEATFSGNTASSSAGGGGAIYGTTTISGDEATFTSNMASNDGGAIFGTTIISDGKTTFSDNRASDGDGGAIYGIGVSITGGTVTFADNEATDGNGGAIRASNNHFSITGGTVTFKGNAAGGDGGAVYGYFRVYVTGGTVTFENNAARGRGGAVYVDENGYFVASDGDILFRGNTHGTSPTEVPNAIYMNNSSSNIRTLHLAAKAGYSVRLYDPIESNDTRTNLTIAINQTGADDPNTSSQTYTGLVALDMSDYIGETSYGVWRVSKVYGNTTVHNGTFALLGGAVYGADATNRSFTLNGGATLLTDARLGASSNEVRANSITISAGSILSFDLSQATASTTNLLLTGNTLTVNADITVDIAALDIAASPGTSYTYNLAEVGSGTPFTGVASNADLTIRGETIVGSRGDGSFTLSTTGGGKTLQLTYADPGNGIVLWAVTSGGTWNTADTNWEGISSGTMNPTAVDTFYHGDAVLFEDVGGDNAIVINSGGVEVAAHDYDEDPYLAEFSADTNNPGLHFNGGDWSFSGGEIAGGGIRVTADTVLTFAGVNDTARRDMKQRVLIEGAALDFVAADGETVAFVGFDTVNFGATDGGAIWLGNDATLTLGKAGSTGTLEFAGNTASNYGGAISGTTTISGGEATFTGNTASYYGGAIFGTTTISGDEATFTGNTASSSGGAIYGPGVSITGGTVTFADNKARNGNGGAIWAGNGDFSITGGAVTFEGNTAGGSGGAVYGYNDVYVTGGTVTFEGNTAGGDGGAVYGLYDVYVTGGAVTFENNAADGSGGAVFVFDSGSFVASDGDILFRGNTHIRSTAEVPNAIYMSNYEDKQTLHLAAAGHSVRLYDPIESYSANRNLTIDINHEDANPSNTGQTYTGQVTLDMSDYIGNTNYNAWRVSKVYGDTTVYNGTFALLGGAVYGANATDNPSFTLNEGATLLTDARDGAASNEIRAIDITINKGSTLQFDMAKAVASGEFNLVLTSGNSLDLSGIDNSNHFTIDLLNFGATNGEYNLVQASDATTDFTGLYDVAYSKGNERYGEVEVLTRDSDKNEIYAVVKNADGSRELVWNGDTAQPGWNRTYDNWLDNGVAIYFKDGDAVTFTAAAEIKDVLLDAHMYVADMVVEGGAYIFRGSGISSTDATYLTSFTERLVIKNNGTAADFYTDLSFAGGLSVETGARMGLGAGNTFSAGTNGDIVVADGATITFFGTATGGALTLGSYEGHDITIGSATLIADLGASQIVFAGESVVATVMTASGVLTLSDQANVTGGNDFHTYAFSVSGNRLILTITGSGAPSSFADLAASPQSLAMAQALDQARANGITPDGELGAALAAALASGDRAAAAAVLRELSGAALSGGLEISPMAAKHARLGLWNLWRWIRNKRDRDEEENPVAGAGGLMSLRHCPRGTWQFWAEGAGTWSKATTGNADPGYEATLWGGTVAGFRSLGEFTVGAALSASHAKLDWDESHGKTKGDSFSGALFATFERDGWFASIDGMWGTTDVESRRRLPLAGLSASADYRTHWYGADLQVGKYLDWCDWRLTPSGGLRWYRYDSPGASEKGAGNAGYRLHGHHQTSFELFANLDVSRSFRLAGGVVLRPRLSAGAALETADRRATPTLSFLGNAAIPAFTGYSPKRGRLAGLIEAGLEVDLTRNLTLYGQYQGEFSNHNQRHTGKIGVAFAF